MDLLQFFVNCGLSPRPQQKEVLTKVQADWDKYKYIAINAPTGVGKTHIALSIADNIVQSYILTGTKNLQAQYEDTSSKVVDIKGRNNYQCQINPIFAVDEAPCLANKPLKGDCIRKGTCDYYRQVGKAREAQITITNYSYFFAATSRGCASDQDQDDPKWKCRPAIIMDEAHDLEKHLISNAEIRLNFNDLWKTFGVGSSEFRVSPDMDVNREHLQTIVEEITKTMEEISEKIEATFKEGAWVQRGKPAEIPKSVNEKIKKMTSKNQILADYKGKLVFYLERSDFDLSPWVETVNEDENSILLSPLTAKDLFDKCLNHLGEKFVFLSATLPPADELCRELGLKRDEMLYIEVDTPFDPAKSPIHVLEVAKMGYKDLEKSLPQIIDVVEAILDMHPNEKGIVHTGNYRIAKAILDGVSKKTKARLIARDTSEVKVHNTALLKMHYDTDEPTVLVSPSMTTGIDLKDDLARFQIIVKLPFPSLADPRIKKKSELHGDWYLMQMWIEVLQAAGRATRDENDHSATYVLDSSFTYFLEKAKRKIPKWFTDRIQ